MYVVHIKLRIATTIQFEIHPKMPRNKIDKQSTWHYSSCADSDTFFNLSIKDEFQSELLQLHLTLGVLHT